LPPCGSGDEIPIACAICSTPCARRRRPERRVEQLARLPFVDVPDARVDTHRSLRSGCPRWCSRRARTARQIADIAPRCAKAARTCS
jgi:NCAIR mutase (PurE)-related protein